MRTLFYFPLEPYQERYTCQLSASKTGWLESRWIENNVNYYRIDGTSLNTSIKNGSVLDSNGRGYWACSQIMEALKLLNDGKITEDDCLYFDDFWHPGIEALSYAFHLNKIHPKMFAMLHAQSVDVFDFTHPMRRWMRDFEKGIGKILDGIFVTSTILKELCVDDGITESNKIHICGLPYNSSEVRKHFPNELPEKKKQVVFSSRWDTEKCPHFFLRVVDFVLCRDPDIKFVITTSSKQLKSNDPVLLSLLETYLKKYPKNLELRENQTKEQYYFNLLESKIQFNCADQDFVSWTLLEATQCGCIPVYPNYRSFPEVFDSVHCNHLLYDKNDVFDASEKIIQFVNENHSFITFPIYSCFDLSWKRMLNVMEGKPYDQLYCY